MRKLVFIASPRLKSCIASNAARLGLQEAAFLADLWLQSVLKMIVPLEKKKEKKDWPQSP